MLKRFFVTGTDTSVGKTVASRALLQALAASGKTVAGYKPVAKGSKETPEGLRNKDALVLQSVSSLDLPYQAINPIALSEEESSVAHSCPINYSLLSNGLLNLCEKVDHVVVEGTGGWRSLMNDLRPLSEWVVQEQMAVVMAVVMVVGIQEGCINHALLTAQAIASDGLPLIGWVANRINPGLAHYAEIINVLSKKLPAPLVGELPYLPRAEQRDLAQYINLQMATGMLVADRILA
ncbi:dethiobiotin synthase [Kosakonia radicincitans]|uniref:dethiobiotin synthase n=1 Tax=Kosakonia radicincitans TaxID=283686 RepID=UPI0005C2C6DD|nr:dethiobiotin synthase [Kosakonia radicincitans]KIS43546.1 dethiobiotin synthase [Kosakonia radicincitans YD4]